MVSAPKYTKPLEVTFKRLDSTLKVSFLTTVSVQVSRLSDISSVSADMMTSFSSSVRSAGLPCAKRVALIRGMLTEPSSLPILPPGRSTTRLPTTLGSSMRVCVLVELLEKIDLGSGFLSSASDQVAKAPTSLLPAARLAVLTAAMILSLLVWYTVVPNCACKAKTSAVRSFSTLVN